MDAKVENLDKEVVELDKELAILSTEYKTVAKNLEETNQKLDDISTLLNKLCTKQEKDGVIIQNLQRELQKYQQYTYGIVVGVIVFIITQMVLLH